MIDKVRTNKDEITVKTVKEFHNIKVTPDEGKPDGSVFSYRYFYSEDFPPRPGNNYTSNLYMSSGERVSEELGNKIGRGGTLNIDYLKAEFWHNGYYGYMVNIIKYQLYKPEPPKPPTPDPEPPKPTYPHYQAEKFYFQNQLVSTFSNLLSTVAELKKDGSIDGKSSPNLRLLRNGQPEGRIIFIRPTFVNNGELAVIKKNGEFLDFYRLQSVPQFQRPRDKPYTESDKEVILTARAWKGANC